MKSSAQLLTMAVAVCAGSTGGAGSLQAAEDAISLAGAWSFRLDRADQGITESWFAAGLPDTIKLPGSMAQAGLGDDVSVDTKWTGQIVDRSWFTEPRYERYRKPGQVKVPFWLTPVKHYVGAAWYQRRVTIPQTWAGRRIVLFLERCHWETTVWVDDREASTANSLATAHEHDLSALLTPGEHRLTIRVDNRVKIDVGENAHSISDHTQTNWNGIVGAIELRASDPVFIEDVQVYPDVTRKTAKASVIVRNTTASAIQGTLSIRAISAYPDDGHKVPAKQIPFRCEAGRAVLDVDYEMGEDIRPWDEFSPNVYTLTASFRAAEYGGSKSVDFGMRELGVDGTQFTINGRKRFVRGTLECCIFPLTGYPPTDVESWTRILTVAKAHGLNQLRFHSWCPPEAAFIAGDRLGFLHQVEACVWTTVGQEPRTDAFIRDESDRILKAYGNHPSFCFLAHGNEPGGDRQKQFLGDLVGYWKKKDPRRLYTSASGWPLIPQSDYHSAPEPRVYHWGEQLRCRLNARPPETVTDYRDFISKQDKPVVSHEIGEWCVYPDFKEIDKYTGVLKARNFEIFRDGLAEHHMLDQAQDFLIASGKLQTLCYKEDIESALRTAGMAGFQLLDLHDFPGQGTALVGVLNPFWESKGYVTPEQYHRFCCETVPLARMTKRIWTADETFHASIEIAHFGPAPMEGTVVTWTLLDDRGRTVARGEFPARTIPLGNGRKLGDMAALLSEVQAASKLTLTASLKGTAYANDWDIWVYPPKVGTVAPPGILVTDDLNDEARATLRKGGKVLLVPRPGRVRGGESGPIPAGFTSIFWNTAWTRGQAPHTLGILCKPKHPALGEFPTEFHSNWQWWDLVSKSQIMDLDGLPPSLRPIVQVIDDWVTNRRLGLVFEASVDGGKLLVCSIDLSSDLEKRPVARQMLHSLLQYMDGVRFAPAHAVELDAIQGPLKRPASAP
jgi:hypothetical protein